MNKIYEMYLEDFDKNGLLDVEYNCGMEYLESTADFKLFVDDIKKEIASSIISSESGKYYGLTVYAMCLRALELSKEDIIKVVGVDIISFKRINDNTIEYITYNEDKETINIYELICRLSGITL